MTDKLKLYQSAFDKWGVANQMDMVVEECAELIKAMQKLKRAKTDEDKRKCFEDLVDELADVEIMTEQTKFVYSLDSLVRLRKEYKLNRLQQRVNK